MKVIREALGSVEGSKPEDLDACAGALEMLLLEPTRDFIMEWLDIPAPAFEGKTARMMIADGRAADVAQTLWGLVDGVAV